MADVVGVVVDDVVIDGVEVIIACNVVVDFGEVAAVVG